MICHSCSRPDLILHTRKWISMKSTIDKLSFHKTYSDAAEFHLTLCTECFTREALKGTRHKWKMFFIFLLIPTIIGQSSFAWSEDGVTHRVILTAFIVILWTWNQLVYRGNVKRLKNNKLLPVDDKYFIDYATTISAREGRDMLLTKNAWYKYVGKRRRSRVDKVGQYSQTNGYEKESQILQRSKTVTFTETS